MSYWQDESGVWWCRFYSDGTKSGPRPRRKLGEIPAQEAKRRYEILKGRAAARRDGFAEALTLAELVEIWRPIQQPKYSAAWAAATEQKLVDHILPRLGHLILDEEGGFRRGPRLTVLQIDRYRALRTKDGTMPATRNREVSLVKSIIRRGQEWGEVPRLAFHLHAVHLEPEEEKTVWIEPEEWARFRAVLTSPEAWAAGRAKIRVLAPAKEGAARRYGGPRLPGSEDDLEIQAAAARFLPIFETLLFTGSRLAEIVRLRWDQVDLKAGRIRIEQPKTKKRVKNSTKTQELIPELKALLESLPRGIGKAPVFPGPTGGPWDVRFVQRVFARARDVAGIRSAITPHSIRHTTASWLVQAGYTAVEVKAVLGHSQLRTTERYMHLGPTHVRAATSAVAAIAAAGKIGRPSGALLSGNPEGGGGGTR